jgi:hypothetical protein
LQVLFSTTAALRARSAAARWAAVELARLFAADVFGCSVMRAVLLVDVIAVGNDRPVGKQI